MNNCASSIWNFLVQKTDLSTFDNRWFDPGAGALKRLLWYLTSWFWFESGMLVPYAWKRNILRAYGARIGKRVVVKPRVQIKYPWKLTIGDHAWIGEHAWIDNLDSVEIGANACISQGALILSGNHDYSKASFDLMVKANSNRGGRMDRREKRRYARSDRWVACSAHGILCCIKRLRALWDLPR